MPNRIERATDREALLRHLRLCYWRTLNRLDRALEDSALTARQFLMLQLLEEKGPCKARTICLALSVTPADVTGLSARLERKRLIRRLRSLEDRREVILELTDQGLQALRAARRRRDKVVDELIASMSNAEFQGMMRGLGKLLGELTNGKETAGPGAEPSPPDAKAAEAP